MSKKSQQKLWESEWWEKHWQDMPEFTQEDNQPYKSLIIHFKTKEDMENFSKLIGYRIKLSTKYLWFPLCKLLKTKKVYL